MCKAPLISVLFKEKESVKDASHRFHCFQRQDIKRRKASNDKEILIHKLDGIDPKANYAETLEEEVIDAYDTTVKRMKAYYDKEFAILTTLSLRKWKRAMHIPRYFRNPAS